MDCPLVKRKAENQTFGEILESIMDPAFREVMKIIAGFTATIGCCSHSDRSDPMLIEQFSAIVHEEWSEWASSISVDHKKMLDAYQNLLLAYQQETGTLLIGGAPFWQTQRDRLARWDTLIKTPYSGLSEEMKEHDRKWGRKLAAVVDGHQQPIE
jgi:hypothetical protein